MRTLSQSLTLSFLNRPFPFPKPNSSTSQLPRLTVRLESLTSIAPRRESLDSEKISTTRRPSLLKMKWDYPISRPSSSFLHRLCLNLEEKVARWRKFQTQKCSITSPAVENRQPVLFTMRNQAIRRNCMELLSMQIVFPSREMQTNPFMINLQPGRVSISPLTF